MYLMTSPKWTFFQESLAKTLGLTVAVVSFSGKVKASYNALPPFSYFGDYPALASCYEDYFKGIVWESSPLAKGKLVYDPLGLPAALLPLEGDGFLFMGGCMDNKDTSFLEILDNRLKEAGVPYNKIHWLKAPLFSKKDLTAVLQNMESLYSQIGLTLDEDSGPGQNVLTTSVMEEINKLIVGSLSPQCFNLKNILDLVAGSLILLFDGEGAWVFTYSSGEGASVSCKGADSTTLNILKDKWEEISGRGEDPALFIESRHLEEQDIWKGRKVKEEIYRSKCASVFIGVIGARVNGLENALGTFLRQVVIALEASGLYGDLQHCMRRWLGCLCNAIRHGLIVANYRGDVLVVNRAAKTILKSLDGGFILGEPLQDGRFFLLRESIEDVLETGGAFIRKQGVFGAGENQLHLRWDTIPIIREDDAITGAILIVEDITEQVGLLREMRRWEKMSIAGEMAASLAHEIRNPLATAKASIQLYNMVGDAEKRKELMEKLNNELDRMNQILSNFLSVTRKETHEEPFKLLDLIELLREMEFLFKGEALLYEIDLVVRVPENRVEQLIVCGSANGLKQVFLNIAKNAIEAMSKGGRLEVDLHWDESLCRISFLDNGAGISRDNLELIKRPFFTTKLNGTGLGLSVSNKIMESMGGEIRIESKPGSGTLVEVIMPRWKE